MYTSDTLMPNETLKVYFYVACTNYQGSLTACSPGRICQHTSESLCMLYDMGHD
jgi:hypothetical protein